MTTEELCRGYLERQRATLWGRAFDLSQEESFEEAVAFLASAVTDVRELWVEAHGGA